MSIGKSGIKNLAFVEDEHIMIEKFKGCEDVSNESESIGNPVCTELYNGKKITAKGNILIASLAASVLAVCTSFSLIAPFFPRVAESKGLRIHQYSLIFAVGIFLPPLLSRISIKMTPKITLITGMLVNSICATIFAFLELENDSTKFFVLCLTVRIFWSVGSAASTTSVYLCGTLLFPNHISTIYAAIEIGAGLGFMSGPFFGGYLFEMGGFRLPFLVTACLCLLAIIPIHILVQNELKPKDKNNKPKPTTVMQAIRVPGVSINLLISAVTCCCIGFNESTLDFHLREIADLTPSQVGKIFLITGLVYSVFTFIFGQVVKKWSQAYYIVYLGLSLVLFSFVVVGPLPFLPIEPHLTNVLISQFSFGVGMGALFVISFDDCIKESKIHLPDNEMTMATISGLYTSSYATGTFLGPSIGGQLVSKFGYRNATLPMFFAMIALIFLVTYYIFKLKSKAPATTIRTVS